jgi:uncharacterized protein (DUF2147 family)
MKKRLLCLLIAVAPYGACAAELKGKWLTDEGKGHVLFESCGSKMCGKIVWLKEPNDESGKPHVDALNQDKNLRSRPIIGLKLTELEPDGNGSWKGIIYNPEDGKSYKAQASIQRDGSLLVKGCIMGGLLCDDQTWKRVN